MFLEKCAEKFILTAPKWTDFQFYFPHFTFVANFVRENANFAKKRVFYEKKKYFTGEFLIFYVCKSTPIIPNVFLLFDF